MYILDLILTTYPIESLSKLGFKDTAPLAVSIDAIASGLSYVTDGGGRFLAIT